jgi:hypothetical protein
VTFFSSLSCKETFQTGFLADEVVLSKLGKASNSSLWDFSKTFGIFISSHFKSFSFNGHRTG